MTTAPKVSTCRSCGASLGNTFMDLGEMPLANAYLGSLQRARDETFYPLHAKVCDRCWLVQLDHVVAPEVLFGDYSYFSSFSDTWLRHARRFAMWAIDEFDLGPESCVVEIASNDGYLLKHFIDRGVPALGIEPAANVAEAARAAGIPTDIRYFGRDVAQDLADSGYQADLLIGNNVIAHVADIDGFVAGLALLVAADGVISLEFPHLLQLIEHVQFDTIYHEHSFYLSLVALEAIFERHGLRTFDVAELPTHGGSLRVLACPTGAPMRSTARVAELRTRETVGGLTAMEVYRGFAERVETCRAGVREFFNECRGEGKQVAGYGAAAKGVTLLNYCRITVDEVPYVVDRSPHKQGRFVPGIHMPIRAPEVIFETKPHYLLVLPWNLRQEIATQMSGIRGWGGRFVVPLPRVEVFD